MVAEVGGGAAAEGRVLVYNPGSGSLDDELRARLLAAFPGHVPVAIEPGRSLEEAYASCPTADDAEVVVAGGDGTVEGVARCVAGTRRRLGILPLGTFNNFARALKLPLDFDAAVAMVKSGTSRPVTIGWAGDRPFLEAAIVGVFGEVIGLGEAAKELRYGEIASQVRAAAREHRFTYSLDGSAKLHGNASSLIFANTPTMGALMDVGDSTPEEPDLELEVVERDARVAAIARLVNAALRRGSARSPRRRRVVRVFVETDPPVRVFADAFDAGSTPLEIRADPSGLNVIMAS